MNDLIISLQAVSFYNKHQCFYVLLHSKITSVELTPAVFMP